MQGAGLIGRSSELTTPNLLDMVRATAVFAPRGLPVVKVDDIGVIEHNADAHVDAFAEGGLAQSAQKLAMNRARSEELAPIVRSPGLS